MYFDYETTWSEKVSSNDFVFDENEFENELTVDTR